MNELSWSTAGVPKSAVREYWQQAVASAINDVDLRIEDVGQFRAELRQRKLGPLALSHIDVHGTQILRRTPTIINRSDTPLFSVIQLVAGNGWLRQCGREVAFGPDHCVLVDNREPYEIAIVGRGESLSIHMPAPWLKDRLLEARRAVAIPLAQSRPWVRQLTNLMTAANAASPARLPAELFAQHFGTTLALAAAEVIEASVPQAPNGFRALQLTLDELSSAPRLRAEDVAAAHQISTRQLHHIYSGHGTTFRQELIRLRLHRARQMLVDERFRSVSVQEIARRSGFSDARHFRRRFSQHFGTSPAMLRP